MKLGIAGLVTFAAGFLTVALTAGAMATAREPVIVVLGDSLTAGLGLPQDQSFPAQLEKALKAKGQNVTIANAGVSGDTAANGLDRFDWAVPPEASAVIVELGANDALQGLPPEATKKALEEILKRLQARGLPVLLAGMEAPRNMGREYVDQFSAVYRDLAAALRCGVLPVLPRRACGRCEPVPGRRPAPKCARRGEDRGRDHAKGRGATGQDSDERLKQSRLSRAGRSSLPTIYDLKPKFQALLRPICVALVRAGITANAVTGAALALSMAHGAWLASMPTSRWPLLLLPVTLFVRMALNAIDGMMAREHGQASAAGAVLNELSDVVADAALYLPFALIPGVDAQLVVLVVIAGIIAEMAGALGPMLGGMRRYNGPLGKSDRAFAFGLLAVLLGLGLTPGTWTTLYLSALLLLGIVTVLNRARSVVKGAKSK